MARTSAIALTDTGFKYDDCHYAYNQVSSLFFYYVVTDVRMNVFLHAGSDHQADLDIYVDGRTKPIKIRTGIYFTYLTIDRTEKRAKSVIELYHLLARETFRFRLQRYVDMLAKHGYFIYDGKKIFSDGRVSDGKREINLKTDRPILRKPFMVYYEIQKTFTEKLLHLWDLQDFIIITRHDADAFFCLLDRLFGLRWENK